MKTESTVTPGSRVETFNTMVSASGLLQLKTFLPSPIKIQILRNAFRSVPQNIYEKTPKKKNFFQSSRWNCCRTHRRRQKSLSGVGLFRNANTNTRKKVFWEELGEKVTNSLITNGKFFKPKTRQPAKNSNFNSTQTISMMVASEVLGKSSKRGRLDVGSVTPMFEGIFDELRFIILGIPHTQPTFNTKRHSKLLKIAWNFRPSFVDLFATNSPT